MVVVVVVVVVNNEGYAAVHLASLYSREETIRHLVQKKADINATGGDGENHGELMGVLENHGELMGGGENHGVLMGDGENHGVLMGVLEESWGAYRMGRIMGCLWGWGESWVLMGPREQTAAHLVANRSTGAAVALIKTVLMHAKQDLRLVKDSRGDIPLFLAVEASHQGLVRELVFHHGGDQVKAIRGHTRDTALHIACRKKDTDMVKILVEAGSNTDVQNAAGQTPLHIAAEEGDEPTVKFFYTVHANPNIMDKFDRTPIHVAAENGFTPVVDLLAEKYKASVMDRTKDGSTLVHIASLHGHPDTVMAFLRKGVPLHMPNKSGARCIHTAAQRGHVGVVNAILHKGEHVDVTTNLLRQEAAIVEALLESRTNLTMCARSVPLLTRSRATLSPGQAALTRSVPLSPGQCHSHQVSATLTRSVPLSPGQCHSHQVSATLTRSVPLSPALHLSARVQDGEKCAEMLLKSGADANLPKDDGQTPLHLAAYYGNLKTLKLLLEDDSAKPLLQSKNSETPVHYVATSGNEAVLDEMLQFAPQDKIQKLVNMQSSRGWSPLLNAAENGHEGIVSTLLDHHARVDVFDSEGKAALHLAAEHGYKLVIDALLTHKAFVNARSMSGLTALHLAAMKGFNDLVRSLITKSHAQKEALTLTKQTPLHLAAEEGQLEVCDTLLQLGADYDATNDGGQKAVHVAAMRNNSEVDGNTCAHIAALQGSVDVVRELMRHNRGVVINGKNRVGESTTLHLAAEGGHATLVKFLIENGASPKAENGMGFTAVHMAARYGHIQVLDTLKEVTSLRITSKKLGLYALHIAAYYGQTEIVRELLSHIPATIKSDPPILSGGRPFLPDLGAEADLTPLHLAAHEGNEGVVRILFNIPGVQPDVTSRLNVAKMDKRGRTGLHLAAMHGHYHLVALLMGQGAELGAKDRDGLGPLHYCARAGHLEVVKLLVEAGASPEDKSVEGKTPITFAVSSEHVDVYNYLINKKHDSYKLLEDKKYVHDLTLMSKKHNHSPLEEFILLSPAPVDLATKLAHTLLILSDK
ncbi:Ankyrin-3-like 5, partial [Homarus americanus]